MAVIHLNQEQFDKAVPAAPIAMVDFWAQWCGPCRMLAPTVEKLGADYEGKALIGKVDVDEEPELARRYGVMSIPTVIFFRDGVELERKVGLMPEEAYARVLDDNAVR